MANWILNLLIKRIFTFIAFFHLVKLLPFSYFYESSLRSPAFVSRMIFFFVPHILSSERIIVYDKNGWLVIWIFHQISLYLFTWTNLLEVSRVTTHWAPYYRFTFFLNETSPLWQVSQINSSLLYKLSPRNFLVRSIQSIVENSQRWKQREFT